MARDNGLWQEIMNFTSSVINSREPNCKDPSRKITDKIEVTWCMAYSNRWIIACQSLLGELMNLMICASFYKWNGLCLYHKAIFIFSPSFKESYPKKRNYTMEILPSASLDTFPSENENFLCDLADTAVTKKPCSLEIARAPSPRTGNIS